MLPALSFIERIVICEFVNFELHDALVNLFGH